MNAGQVLLDGLIAGGAILALVGLGGAVSVLRGNRKENVRITVKQDHGPTQTVTVRQDSVVVEQLNRVAGIHIPAKDSAADTGSSSSDSNKSRHLEIAALVAGVTASIAAVLPFAVSGKFVVFVVVGLGALALTSLGEVVARLKIQFTRQQWQSSTTREQVEAIRDAALLREFPSQSGNPGSNSSWKRPGCRK